MQPWARLGHLLALHVAPADEQDRAQVGELARQIQQTTAQNVELAYVDQGYAGQAAKERGCFARQPTGNGQTYRGQTRIHTAATKMGRGKKLRMAVRFRRRVRDYERLAAASGAFQFLAFAHAS